jgi:hypothetical protein
VPDSSSPPLDVAGFSGLPYSFGGFDSLGGFASMPYNTASFDTAPALRYGDFPEYSPEFGLLGQDGASDRADRVQNAGRADALGNEPGQGVGLPVLIAVLALAGASAGLVRTWVIRTAQV